MSPEKTERTFQLPPDYSIPSLDQSHPLYEYANVLRELFTTLYKIEIELGKLDSNPSLTPSFYTGQPTAKELVEPLKEFTRKLYIAEQGSSRAEAVIKRSSIDTVKRLFFPHTNTPNYVVRPAVPEYSSRIRKAVKPLSDSKNVSYRTTFELVKRHLLDARKSLLDAINQSSNT